MTHFNILISSATNNLNEINNIHFKNIINELKHIEDYLQKKNDELKVRENSIKVTEIELKTKLLEINDFKKVSVYKSLSDQVLQKDLEISILTRKLERRNLQVEKNKTNITSNIKVLDIMNSNLTKGLNTIELIINDSNSNQLTKPDCAKLIGNKSVELTDNKSTESINNDNELTDNKSTESINNDNELTDNKSTESINNDNELTDNKSTESINNNNELTDNDNELTDNKSTESINNETNTGIAEIEFFEEEINEKSYYFSSDNFIYKKLRDDSIGKRILGSFTEDDLGNLDIDWKNK